MAWNIKETLKKKLAPAAILTATVLGLQYAFSFIGYPVQPLYSSVGPVTPVTTTASSTFLQWLGGYIPISGSFLMNAIFMLFLASYMILVLGSLLVNGLNLPNGKGRTMNLAAEILYGSLVLFLVLKMTVPIFSWTVLVGLAIYTLIAAYIAGWLGDKFNVSM